MKFDNERPIYLQIVELMKLDIIAGRFHEGEKIPSVRELAAKYRVNPNTMQRAFAELENMNLVYTERTNGRFVTNQHDVIIAYRNELAKAKVKEFVQYMNNLGVSEEESITLLKSVRKGENK